MALNPMQPKRFIIWGVNYPPELTGIAPFNRAMCEYLASKGHRVSMVTSFSYYPGWRKRDEDKGTIFRTDVLNGVPVHRCWHYVPPKPTPLKRILHELSFIATSLLRVLLLPRPDVFIVVSPPLLLGVAAWFAGVVKRAPFVFHVQDLQPDAAASLGMLRGGLLLRALYGLESFAYRKAARVSGISPGMLRAFQSKGVSSGKTILFPNGINLAGPQTLPARGRFRRRMGISASDVLALYSGNLGVKHGVDILLEAARLPAAAAIRTVICGDGARREELERRAREMGLGRVTLLPLQPEADYLEMLVDADIYVVTQQPSSGSLFFPSKLLNGLAMSKAVLVVADENSELTRAARDSGFAAVAPPGRPDEVARALKSLAADAGRRAALGQAGRRYVEQFETNRILAQLEAHLLAMTLPIRKRARRLRAIPASPKTDASAKPMPPSNQTSPIDA